MKKKNKFLIALAVIVGAAFVSGITILAVTSYGSTSDPLVTLSYLTDKLRPQIMNDVGSSVSAASSSLSGSLSTQIQGYETEMNSKLPNAVSSSDTFSVVTLKSGQTVLCSPGTEIMLRIGSASAAGASSPALIDSTSGSELPSGNGLTVNHMYMVTISGNGISASADTAKILIRGEYTIN